VGMVAASFLRQTRSPTDVVGSAAVEQRYTKLKEYAEASASLELYFKSVGFGATSPSTQSPRESVSSSALGTRDLASNFSGFAWSLRNSESSTGCCDIAYPVEDNKQTLPQEDNAKECATDETGATDVIDGGGVLLLTPAPSALAFSQRTDGIFVSEPSNTAGKINEPSNIAGGINAPSKQVRKLSTIEFSTPAPVTKAGYDLNNFVFIRFFQTLSQLVYSFQPIYT
jgi:hypothetical protein